MPQTIDDLTAALREWADRVVTFGGRAASISVNDVQRTVDVVFDSALFITLPGKLPLQAFVVSIHADYAAHTVTLRFAYDKPVSPTPPAPSGDPLLDDLRRVMPASTITPVPSSVGRRFLAQFGALKTTLTAAATAEGGLLPASLQIEEVCYV